LAAELGSGSGPNDTSPLLDKYAWLNASPKYSKAKGSEKASTSSSLRDNAVSDE
jgi:hypothetical protein